ncbi:hypothetical protein RCL1_004741 [Eukaryota sp. TZLM3-RCL]
MDPQAPTLEKRRRRRKTKDTDESVAAELKEALTAPVAALVEEEVAVHHLQAAEDSLYSYESLLNRVYDHLRERNPQLFSDRKKLVLRPPRVERDTGRKTVWHNFVEQCNSLHRSQDHVMNFFLAEMGATASVDSSGRLLIRGRYTDKEIEHILRNYIQEYVLCKLCKSGDTEMHKEGKLYLLTCKCCNAQRAVQTIQKGFLPTTTRRKRE